MTDESSHERRQFSRVTFESPVTILQDGNEYAAQLEDISLNGVLVNMPGDYHIRTDMPCTLQVYLGEETLISMQVVLVHSSNRFLGFHCTSIDMNSIIHLRRLIEMNLGDENASERVLAELLKRRQE